MSSPAKSEFSVTAVWMEAAKQPVSLADLDIFAFKQIKRIVKHAC